MLIEIVTSSEYRKIVASKNHNDVQKHMNYEQLDFFRKNVKSPQVFINCKFNWFVQEEINMELNMRLHEVREKQL